MKLPDVLTVGVVEHVWDDGLEEPAREDYVAKPRKTESMYTSRLPSIRSNRFYLQVVQNQLATFTLICQSAGTYALVASFLSLGFCVEC